MKLLLAVISATLSFNAYAGVYKCKGEDGTTKFQQVPCATDETGEEVRIWIDPSRPKPPPVSQDQYSDGMGLVETFNQQRMAPPPEAVSEPAPRTRVSGISSAPSQRLGDCPEGQVPINRSSHSSGSGWSDRRGYEKLRCGRPVSRNNRTAPPPPPPPVTVTPQPFQPVPYFPNGDGSIRDTNGNMYRTDPNSAIVYDQKSGKQCFKIGGTVSCP